MGSLRLDLVVFKASFCCRFHFDIEITVCIFSDIKEYYCPIYPKCVYLVNKAAGFQVGNMFSTFLSASFLFVFPLYTEFQSKEICKTIPCAP